MKFKEYIKKKNKKQKRTEMYKEYYKNLSPKTFTVKSYKNKIIIEVNAPTR